MLCDVNPDTFFKSKNAKNPNKDIFFPKIWNRYNFDAKILLYFE